MSDLSPRARLEAAAAAIVGEGRRVVGVGWATVDLERAATELASDMALELDAFADAPGSVVLGAHCRIARGAIGGGEMAVVLLEPATEGRLAGHLARHDEGPAVVWLEGGAQLTPGVQTALLGAQTAPLVATPGPFGPEAIQPSVGDRPDLLRFIVAVPPGTIRS